jgi:glycosyltransferase involved in cell wall biosynthesis
VYPFINNESVVFAGNCNAKKRDELLGNALALLHLILFDEPFGLSVAEAMCCGTPVVAFNRGAMPELILSGKTGFLVNTMEEAINATGQLSAINRIDCRQRATTMFSKEKMTEDYLQVYQQILAAI